MPGRLQDKVAIITGAGQGIGAAIALRLAEGLGELGKLRPAEENEHDDQDDDEFGKSYK